MARLVLVDANETGIDTLRRALDLGHRVTLVRGASRRLYPVDESVRALFSRTDEVIDLPVTSDADSMTEALATALRRAPVDAVICQLESAVEAVSAACERVGLPFTPAAAVAAARNKARCRELLTQAGLANAGHRLVFTPDQAVAAAGHIGYPVIVKPVSGMDSLLAHRADTAQQVHEAGERILAGASNAPAEIAGQLGRGILVEQLLRGPLVSVELGMLDGKAYRFLTSGRARAAHNECVELGAVMPANLGPERERACFEYAEQVCRALGLDRGIFHIELIDTAHGPRLVEVNPRVMGGVMTRLYRRLTGVDFADHVLDLYQGREPVVPAARPDTTLAVRKIMPRAAGRIPESFSPERATAGLDGIVDAYHYTLAPGTEVRADQVLSRCVIEGEDWARAAERADRLVDRMERHLGMALHHTADMDRDGCAPAAARTSKDTRMHNPDLTGPVLRTEIPGPRSRELLERQLARESNAVSYPRRLPIAPRRGYGCFVEDEDGNVLFDFLSGAGALALGYGHPDLVDAIQRQVAELAHALDFPTAVKDEYTDELLALFPDALRGRLRIHYCAPSGANAVEAAVKLCKTATGRGEVIAFHGAFHGMSHATMALSGDASVRAEVPNTMPGVHFVPFSSCSRCPMGLKPDTCDAECATYLERTLQDTHNGGTKPAAVLLELVQGEGGGIPAMPLFARRVREATRRLDIPLIVDEVQTGFGRTGEWFAFQHYGIEPDVVVLSKMLSGAGMPAAAVVYHERYDRWRPGAHTGTFRGNQLAFAAGTEFLRIMRREDVLRNVRERGRQALDRLRALQARHPDLIADVRGLGLMLAVEFARPATATPWGEMAARVQRLALERGLIAEIGGRGDAVLRLLPPLDISAPLLGAALDLLDDAVAHAAASPEPEGDC